MVRSTDDCWVSAGGASGLRLRPAAGIAFFQAKIHALCGTVEFGLANSAAIGPTSRSEGSIESSRTGPGGRVSWDSRGTVHCSLAGSTPFGIEFGAGDELALLLECRVHPVVRLFVNQDLCLTHALDRALLAQPHTLYPVVSVCGGPAGEETLVEMEAYPAAPPALLLCLQQRHDPTGD